MTEYEHGIIRIFDETNIPSFLLGNILVVSNKIHIIGEPSQNDFPLGTYLKYEKQAGKYVFKKV